MGRTISELKRKVLPMSLHHGIKRLPDDVLADIFDLVVSAAAVSQRAQCVREIPAAAQRSQLALTCNRFSRIVSGAPRLWSYIDGVGNSFQKKLSRPTHVHKSSRLTISLFVDKAPEGWNMEIPTEMRRCRTFLITSSLHESYRRARALHVLQFAKLQFAAHVSTVEALHYTDFSGIILHMLGKWSFPNLTHLSCDGFLLPPCMIDGLTSLCYRQSPPHTNRNGSSLAGFLDSLRSLKRLQHLEFVSLTSSQVERSGASEINVLDEIQLPSLTSLSIDICIEHEHESPVQFMARLTAVLRAPILHTLNICMSSPRSPPVPGWRLFPLVDTFSKLSRVSVELQQTAKDTKKAPKTMLELDTFRSSAGKNVTHVMDLTRRIPALAELKVSMPQCLRPYDYIDTCPALRLFRFEGRILDDMDSFSNLLDRVRDRKGALQYCDIHGLAPEGRGIEREYVRMDGAVGSTHVFWKDTRLEKKQSGS